MKKVITAVTIAASLAFRTQIRFFCASLFSPLLVSACSICVLRRYTQSHKLLSQFLGQLTAAACIYLVLISGVSRILTRGCSIANHTHYLLGVPNVQLTVDTAEITVHASLILVIN